MYEVLMAHLRECAKLDPSNNTYTEAADAIELLQKTQQPKWIPVSERLPEKEDMVIFHYAWTGITGTVYKEVTLATLAELEYVGSKPLAWMPLPEPPKEET